MKSDCGFQIAECRTRRSIVDREFRRASALMIETARLFARVAERARKMEGRIAELQGLNGDLRGRLAIAEGKRNRNQHSLRSR